MTLKDNHGRPLRNLRVAITQQCNRRCLYCHMEGEGKVVRNFTEEMTVDEIAQIVRLAVGLGISKVKLTGGEPLVRKDILEIVRRVAAIFALEDLSMTTNGTLLAPLAEELRSIGLRRVNISIPTLKSVVYNRLTGGSLKDVLDGIEAAVRVGLHPVKLNMLMLKGINDHDVPQMIDFARETGTILQLIELEPISISDAYYRAHHKLLDEFETALRQKSVKTETRREMQNRRIYHLPDATVEIVHPTENTEFCMHCTRLRVTSNGKLKPCLMRNDNLVDILTPLRNGATHEELAELFRTANQKRQPYCKIETCLL